MPKANIEIKRQVEITRDEAVTIEVDVPQHILDDEFDLHDWIVDRMKSTTGNEVSNEVTRVGWDHIDEDETEDYTEVTHII
jgi:hypothetical protein